MMEFFFLIFKIIFILFNLFSWICINGEIIGPLEIIKFDKNEKGKFIYKKIEQFIDLLELSTTSNMFDIIGDSFTDIKITAQTAQSKNIWYLKENKEIGLIKINSKRARYSLAVKYLFLDLKFINNYFLKSLKEFYKNKNEILLYLKIEEVTYSSFEAKETVEKRLKPLHFNIIFEWFGVYNANTGYM